MFDNPSVGIEPGLVH